MELINAVQNNNIIEVQQCLDRNLDIESNYQTWTPLSWAVHGENLEIVSLLLRNHANVNHCDISSWTPLHLAVGNGNIQIICMLLEQGADPNSCDIVKRTPLASASTPEIAELLIQYHASIEHKDLYGNSFLHIYAMEDSQDMIQFFAKFTDINGRSERGRTPLHWASQYCRTENVKLLLEYGADPYITDNEGHTAKDLAYKQEIKDLIDSYGFPVKYAIEE